MKPNPYPKFRYVLIIGVLFLLFACTSDPPNIAVGKCFLTCYGPDHTSSNSMCLWRNIKTGELFMTSYDCEVGNKK